jgi:signal transduction histidine kinase
MTNVLVVDDTPDMAYLLARIVSHLADEVSTVGDGKAALASVAASPPDLILLDVMMPEMTGIEVLRHLKSDEQTSDIPVILVTASGEDDDIIRGLDGGAFDYVTKPFRREVLAARVRSALSFHENANALKTANEHLEQALLDQQRMETELAQNQKLESIGRLAAGIAHEINTPAQYIGDNTRFLRDVFRDIDRLLSALEQLKHGLASDQVADDLLQQAFSVLEQVDIDYIQSETPTAIEQTLDGIERVCKIVRAMKEFSHPGQSEKQATDLKQTIESTLTVSRNEWKYVANVVTEFEEDLPAVPCFVGDLNQALLNLIVNAAQAIGNANARKTNSLGTITISTKRDGNWVEIAIADTGEGIPEHIRDKVFDHFFTTKDVGKGTGQGLSVVQNVVVQKHGGHVRFESQEGVGTTFFIRLPIEDRAEKSEPAEMKVACQA